SASPSGSQCRPFLATNDHFSSSWTLVVCGGKSHQLVVELLGVTTGPQAVADHRVLIDADQAAGLAGAAAIGQVLKHRQGLLRGQAGVKQRGALALREPGLAGAAAEQASP